MKKTNQGKKIFKDIPEDVAKVVHEMMSKWRTPQVIDKTDEEHRDTPEKAWVSGDGIEIICVYILNGAKFYKRNV